MNWDWKRKGGRDFFPFQEKYSVFRNPKTKARVSFVVSSALHYRFQTTRSTPAKIVDCDHEPTVYSTSSSRPL